MYELSDIQFEKIRALVYEQSGISLGDGKKELVKARLGKRLRAGSFKSFAEYFDFVTSPAGAEELIFLIDSISTNLTYFFREDKHFERLRIIITESQRFAQAVKSFNVWSAGCSTGEEAYSLAITIKEAMGQAPINISILATDISTRVLEIAKKGIYHQDKMKYVQDKYLKKYFQYGTGNWANYYRVKGEIREMVKFMWWNLMEPLPLNTAFNIIFCRNVMIYFDKETRQMLIRRFFDQLTEGGFLFIGHSESLAGVQHKFKYIEPSVYRK